MLSLIVWCGCINAEFAFGKWKHSSLLECNLGPNILISIWTILLKFLKEHELLQHVSHLSEEEARPKVPSGSRLRPTSSRASQPCASGARGTRSRKLAQGQSFLSARGALSTVVLIFVVFAPERVITAGRRLVRLFFTSCPQTVQIDSD